jgi:hypothetical protein
MKESPVFRPTWIRYAALGLLLASSAAVQAQAPVTAIAVYPPDINLSFQQDRPT